jgi:hypothetical protein
MAKRITLLQRLELHISECLREIRRDTKAFWPFPTAKEQRKINQLAADLGQKKPFTVIGESFTYPDDCFSYSRFPKGEWGADRKKTPPFFIPIWVQDPHGNVVSYDAAHPPTTYEHAAVLFERWLTWVQSELLAEQNKVSETPKFTRAMSRREIAYAVICDQRTVQGRLGSAVQRVEGERQWWRVNLDALSAADRAEIEKYLHDHPKRPKRSGTKSRTK